MAGSTVSSINEIGAHLQVVLATPVLARQLVTYQQLPLVAAAVPGVEEVAAPALGGNGHRLRPLAVGVAVELRIFGERGQHAAGGKQVAVRQADGITVLAIIGGGGLGDEGVDVGELAAQGNTFTLAVSR